MGALRKSVRDLVATFVEENTECSMINYVKDHVFGKEDGLPLVPKTNHILAACFDIPCPPPERYTALLSFVDEFSFHP